MGIPPALEWEISFFVLTSLPVSGSEMEAATSSSVWAKRWAMESV